MKTIPVVSTKELEKLGRQLAHALSQIEGVSSTLWTEQFYRDNEKTMKGSQPVIFLGPTRVAEQLAETVPEGFSAFGVTCYREGAKAIILAETPAEHRGRFDNYKHQQRLATYEKNLLSATNEIITFSMAPPSTAGEKSPARPSPVPQGFHTPIEPTGPGSGRKWNWVDYKLVRYAALGLQLGAATGATEARREALRQQDSIRMAQYRYGIVRFWAQVLPSYLDENA